MQKGSTTESDLINLVTSNSSAQQLSKYIQKTPQQQLLKSISSNLGLSMLKPLIITLSIHKTMFTLAEDSNNKSFTSSSQANADLFWKINDFTVSQLKEGNNILMTNIELLELGSLLMKCVSWSKLNRDERLVYFNLSLDIINGKMLRPEVDNDFDLIISKAINVISSTISTVGFQFPIPEFDIIDFSFEKLKLINNGYIQTFSSTLDLIGCLLRSLKSTKILEKWDSLLEFHLYPTLTSTTPQLDSPAAKLPIVKLFKTFLSTSTVVNDINLKLKFWEELFKDNKFGITLANESADVRSNLIDILSCLDDEVLVAFDNRQVNFIKSMLLSLLDDQPAIVISNVIGTIGHLLTLKEIQDDALFLLNVYPYFNLLKHENLQIRIRAGWTLGNFCDVLKMIYEKDGDKTLCEYNFTNERIFELLQFALFGSADNDKCKSNGVRSLGILSKLNIKSRIKDADTSEKDLVNRMISVTLKNCEQGVVKTRWNAFHALRMLLTSDLFGDSTETITSLNKVLIVLISTLGKAKNSKVKINCLLCFQELVPLWESLTRELEFISVELKVESLRSLYKAYNGDQVFGELKYREQLESEVKKTLKLVCKMFSKSEVAMLDEELHDFLKI